MRRKDFRPGISDRLEERVVLSRPPSLLRAAVATIRPTALKIGALGDSLTDEYRATPERRDARNFVEILSATRRLRFGAYSTTSRGEPRGAGFANNWAKTGATSDDMVKSQLPGLANQVRRGQVNLVSIFIGSNDFVRYAATFSPFSPPTDEQVAAGLAKVATRLGDNLTTAVRTLMSANPDVKLAISTLPDLRQLPSVAVLAANPLLKPAIDAVGNAVTAYNTRLKALAAEDPTHIAVVDLNAEFNRVAAVSAATGKLNVGGRSIDVRTPGNDPSHLFRNDGSHIGTVGQGLIANTFVNSVGTAFKVTIKPLRQAEILRQARIR